MQVSGPEHLPDTAESVALEQLAETTVRALQYVMSGRDLSAELSEDVVQFQASGDSETLINKASGIVTLVGLHHVRKGLLSAQAVLEATPGLITDTVAARSGSGNSFSSDLADATDKFCREKPKSTTLRVSAERPTQEADETSTTDDTDIGWLSDLYALNDAALADLRFSKAQRVKYVPTFEQVRDAIAPDTAVWLNRQRAAGHQNEVVIPPSIQRVGLLGNNSQTGLIARFNHKQDPDGHGAWVWEYTDRPNWDKDPLHDNGLTAVFPAVILLGDITDPRPGHESEKANLYDEPGLVYTGMSLADQRKALKLENVLHEQAGRMLMAATIGQIILANAQRRLTDRPRVNRWDSYTRLIHYPTFNPDETGQPMILGFTSLLRPMFTLIGTDENPQNGMRRSLVIPVAAH